MNKGVGLVALFCTLVSPAIHAAEPATLSLHPDLKALPTTRPVTRSDTGQVVYLQRCAVCHDHPQERIPPKSLLGTRTHDYIVNALTKGAMQTQASGLSAGEIDAVATHLISELQSSMPAGTTVSRLSEPELHANSCKRPAPRFTL